MVASRKLTWSQTGGETDTKIKRAMAAKAKKSPGNAGETIFVATGVLARGLFGGSEYYLPVYSGA